MWDAEQYLRLEAERTRPFCDLMAQVVRGATARIVDLGCGPGNLTRLLAERWPAAWVTGVDSSPEMLEKTAALAVAGQIDFQQADLAAWLPAEPVDLVVSSAAWQWIADHERLIDHCAEMLAPGGTLAVQLPARFGTSSQTVIDEVAADSRWAATLHGVGLHRRSVHPIAWYAEQLSRRGFQVNAWDTTYLHALSGDDPVLEFLRGTALRPLLARLDEAHQTELLSALGKRLREIYPACGDVTFFPMPRLFFVAERT